MYAIRNRKTNKYIYGTDFRFSPPRQRCSENAMRVYEYLFEAVLEYKRRRCGRDYEIVSMSFTCLGTAARHEVIMDPSFELNALAQMKTALQEK